MLRKKLKTLMICLLLNSFCLFAANSGGFLSSLNENEVKTDENLVSLYNNEIDLSSSEANLKDDEANLNSNEANLNGEKTSLPVAQTLNSSEDYNSLISTIEELIQSNRELLSVIDELENKNTNLSTNLADAISLAESLKKTVEEDQKEIDDLREAAKKISTQLDEDRNATIGLGVSYPLGGTILFNIRPNNFPLGAAATLGFNRTSGVVLSIGLSYSY